MRFELHLQRTELSVRELPLQLDRMHGILLRADPVLDDPGNAEDEAVGQEFQSEAIDAEKQDANCISRLPISLSMPHSS